MFNQITIASYLPFLERKQHIKNFMSRASELDIPITCDTFRQAAVASLLSEHIESQNVSRPSVLVIGDGFGVLSSLLKTKFPEARFTLVDLGKVLLFQNMHLQVSFPEAKFYLQTPETSRAEDWDFRFVAAEQVRDVRLEEDFFDLVINVASMQEMTGAWIELYFALIRKTIKEGGLFYCCNRAKKILNENEVIEIEKYPWRSADRLIFFEEPPFYRWFFSYRRTPIHLKVFGIPVPFGRRFDGEMRHCLVRLTKS
ncbi:MAG: putative sugar O-methyltransferase [Bdellovibrionia bacterium]